MSSKASESCSSIQKEFKAYLNNYGYQSELTQFKNQLHAYSVFTTVVKKTDFDLLLNFFKTSKKGIYFMDLGEQQIWLFKTGNCVYSLLIQPLQETSSLLLQLTAQFEKSARLSGVGLDQANTVHQLPLESIFKYGEHQHQNQLAIYFWQKEKIASFINFWKEKGLSKTQIQACMNQFFCFFKINGSKYTLFWLNQKGTNYLLIISYPCEACYVDKK